MFQSLLENRLQLKVHRETRELTAYESAAFQADGKHLVEKSALIEEMGVPARQMRAPVRDRTVFGRGR